MTTASAEPVCVCGPPGYEGYDGCRQGGCDPLCPVCSFVSTVEVVLEDGSSCRWKVSDDDIDGVLAAIEALIGPPETTLL